MTTNQHEQTINTPESQAEVRPVGTVDAGPRHAAPEAETPRYEESRPSGGTPSVPPEEPVSLWWASWVWFAAVMLVLIGIFNLIDGLMALFRDNYFHTGDGQILVWDLTAWGWILLVVGILQILAGAFLFRGAMLARIAAIALTVLNAISQLAFVGPYPVWSIIIITIDVIVIWALTVHGREGDLRKLD